MGVAITSAEGETPDCSWTLACGTSAWHLASLPFMIYGRGIFESGLSNPVVLILLVLVVITCGADDDDMIYGAPDV